MFPRIFKQLGCILILLALTECSVTPKPPLRTAEKPSKPAQSIEQATLPPVKTDTLRIAMLLPLSGQKQALGKALQDAAHMSLIEARQPHIELLSFDTLGTADGAQAAMQRAMNARAQLVLGPALSIETAAVATLARSYNVPVMSFSNDRNLMGKGVMLLGFMPEEQVERIVGFAQQRGYQDFAALLPSNAYGASIADSLQRSIAKVGGKLYKIEYTYAGPGVSLDTDQAIERLVNALPSTPVAVMVPQGGEELFDRAAKIRNLASIQGKNIQLIGTGQWDDRAHLSNRSIQLGWFAGANPTMEEAFEQRFLSQYGYRPLRLASLSYDAVALLSQLVQADGPTGDITNRLTTNAGFMGVNGLFRLTSNGLTERGLAVMQITPAGFQVIDQAPKRF